MARKQAQPSWLTGRTNAPPSRTKTGNQRFTLDGIEFDSKREAYRYAELSLLLKAGKIRDLQRQITYELIPAQREPDIIGVRGGITKGKCIERGVYYVADFVYVDNETGETVVEDAKGYRQTDAAMYKVFVMKRKLMLWRHGIRVREV